MKKRLLAWLLILAMSLSLLPIGVLAAEVGDTADTSLFSFVSSENEPLRMVVARDSQSEGDVMDSTTRYFYTVLVPEQAETVTLNRNSAISVATADGTELASQGTDSVEIRVADFMENALVLTYRYQYTLQGFPVTSTEIYTVNFAVAEEETTTATVSFTAQSFGGFLCNPARNVEVASDLAERYGYTDSVDGVSALDVLVKAHELTFGEDFTDYLQVSESGWVSMAFGMENLGFAINQDYPYDSSSEYGPWGYTGYTVPQAPVSDGDFLEFFFYQDETWMDFYTYFTQNGQKALTLEGEAGTELSLNLEGFMYMTGSFVGEDREKHAALGPIEEAQLAWVAVESGAVTEIEGAFTDENGNATITLPEEVGTYGLTAIGTSQYDSPCTLPYATVTVTPRTPSLEPGEPIPEAYLGVKTEAKVYDDFENDIWLQYQQRDMQVGDTAVMYPWRVPQIISNATANDVYRPNFHFEIIAGNSVELGTQDTATSVTVTAVRTGTTIVKVTADEATYKDTYYGATSPVNTAYVVYTVGETGTANITLSDELEGWLHYNTIYYNEGDTVPFEFTASAEGAENLTVTLNGEKLEGQDGKYVANLENRSNIIGITATDKDGGVKSVWRVVDARFITVNVENTTNSGEPLKAGDTAKISFTGITMPVYKLATIYNPQWEAPAWGSKATSVTYTNGKLGSFRGKCSQWDLATNNSFEVTFEEAGEYTFHNEDGIFSSWWGSPLGTDMTMNGSGQPNLGAPTLQGNFGKMPDFTVTVLGTVDKAPLEKSIAEAQALNQDDYSEDSWQALTAALEEAIKVNGDSAATEADVTEACNSLQKAMEGLKNASVTVTFTLLGDDLHNSTEDGQVHTLADDNLKAWVETKEYTVEKNTTVWNFLQSVFEENDITCAYSGSGSTTYIQALTYQGVKLGEMDNGHFSGWMYTINGKHPRLGVGQQLLTGDEHIILHYTDDFTREGDKATEIHVNVTIANEGQVALAMKNITVQDRNFDGKFNVDEVLYAAHEAAYPDGAEGYASVVGDYGLSITKLWGNESGLFGYWVNNVSCMSLEDEVRSGDNLVAFIYKMSDWSDAYAKFDAFTYTAEGELTVTLEKAGYDENWNTVFEPLPGASITAYDKDGKEITDCKVQDNGDGTYVVSFAKDGTYTLVAREESLPIVPAVATANVVMNRKDTDAEKIYKETGDLLSGYDKDLYTFGTEWIVLGLARSGREVPSGYYEDIVKYVAQNIDANGRLSTTKSTENSRLILALTAAGIDPTCVGGYNLLKGLNNMHFLKKQGPNGPIWALIALDSHSYEIPAGGDVTREALVAEILAAQLPDGGWTFSGDKSDADMTGMALQALAPYYKENAQVKTAVDKAVAALSAMQQEDGSFYTYDTDGATYCSSESIAQVIVALTALGIDPETDTRFVKNGISAMDALCSYAVDGGGFKHVSDGDWNGMATEQGYYALTAYFRLCNEKTSLYDMSDVKLVKHFVDVKSSDYFYHAVNWAVGSGITSGTSATTFSPNMSCTRAQMVTFLWAAAGKPEPEGSKNPFVDVPEGTWYAKSVQWAYENGYAAGTDATHFSPNATLTRGQAMTFLYAFAGKPEVENMTTSFTDVNPNAWYGKAVLWAYENGITAGTGNNRFGTNATCTRAQIVTFLFGYEQLIKD